MISSIELLIILTVITLTVDVTKSKFAFFAKLALIALAVVIGTHTAQFQLV